MCSLKNSYLEFLIGSIFLILCFLAVYFSYNYAKPNLIGDSYTLYINFDDSIGIKEGTEVKVAGVNVGVVKSKTLKQNIPNFYKAFILIEIRKNIDLPVDTMAVVKSYSMLGNKYISLLPGMDTSLLQNGDTIFRSQSAVDLEAFLKQSILK